MDGIARREDDTLDYPLFVPLGKAGGDIDAHQFIASFLDISITNRRTISTTALLTAHVFLSILYHRHPERLRTPREAMVAGAGCIVLASKSASTLTEGKDVAWVKTMAEAIMTREKCSRDEEAALRKSIEVYESLALEASGYNPSVYLPHQYLETILDRLYGSSQARQLLPLVWARCTEAVRTSAVVTHPPCLLAIAAVKSCPGLYAPAVSIEALYTATATQTYKHTASANVDSLVAILQERQ